ncbi:hypothetical protein HRI_004106500 [Hibiscus trionum]|uniref:Uncharacterized protein n=1 Tax=Hibiscus trionum TaxID=183268 RepID=A0A9W7MHD6_HIBTR|nr:hypothetical protein HRI_004106500 [Hibiscus trionum]
MRINVLGKAFLIKVKTGELFPEESENEDFQEEGLQAEGWPEHYSEAGQVEAEESEEHVNVDVPPVIIPEATDWCPRNANGMEFNALDRENVVSSKSTSLNCQSGGIGFVNVSARGSSGHSLTQQKITHNLDKPGQPNINSNVGCLEPNKDKAGGNGQNIGPVSSVGRIYPQDKMDFDELIVEDSVESNNVVISPNFNSEVIPDSLEEPPCPRIESFSNGINVSPRLERNSPVHSIPELNVSISLGRSGEFYSAKHRKAIRSQIRDSLENSKQNSLHE